MADGTEVDGRYYEVVKTGGIAARLARIARERMHALFLDLCAPGPDTRILDVGVSDVLRDEANMLERSHAWPEAITAVGLGEARAFQAAFPAVRYQRIAAGGPQGGAPALRGWCVRHRGLQRGAGACGQRGGKPSTRTLERLAEATGAAVVDFVNTQASVLTSAQFRIG